MDLSYSLNCFFKAFKLNWYLIVANSRVWDWFFLQNFLKVCLSIKRSSQKNREVHISNSYDVTQKILMQFLKSFALLYINISYREKKVFSLNLNARNLYYFTSNNVLVLQIWNKKLSKSSFKNIFIEQTSKIYFS